MDIELVKQKVFKGEYETAQAARTDVNAALAELEAQAARISDDIAILKRYSASLLNQGEVFIQAMRTAHAQPVKK